MNRTLNYFQFSLARELQILFAGLYLSFAFTPGCSTYLCDFDGDGLCPPTDCNDYDISIGECAGNSGMVAPTGLHPLSDYPVRLEAAMLAEGLGSSLALVDDVTGDEVPDILVGAYLHRTAAETEPGAAYIIPGPFTERIQLSDASTVRSLWRGPQQRGTAGWSVSSAGDINADGINDVLIGDPSTNSESIGRAYVLLGPVQMGDYNLASADLTFVGSNDYDFSAYVVSGVGDINGDGFDDLMVTSPFSSDGETLGGAVYIFFGPMALDGKPVERDLLDADLRILGDSYAQCIGWSASFPGDLNGDGQADLIVASPHEDTFTGHVYIFYGPLGSGDLNIDEADGEIIGEATSSFTGFAVRGGGDLNGDNVGDILIGARSLDWGAEDIGAAYIVHGPVYGRKSLSDISGGRLSGTRLMGESPNDNAGWTVEFAGDLDQDGFEDLVVGAPYHEFSDGQDDLGAVYVLYGPIPEGAMSLGSADAIIYGESNNDSAGYTIAGGRDLNGDSYDDIIVTSLTERDASANELEGDALKWTGKIYAIYGGRRP